MTGYLPVVIYLGVIVAFAVVSLIAARVLGPGRPFAAKLESYECGAEPIGEAWVQFPVGFYLVALVFIVFDALAVFLFPWALDRPSTRGLGYPCDAHVPLDPPPRLGLRVPGAHSRVEIKPPDPGHPSASLAGHQGSSGVRTAAAAAAGG